MNNNEIIGVLYALPEEIILRFLNSEKTVFLKYTAHKLSKKSKYKIAKGHKLYFYASRSNKQVMGEANIISVQFLTKDEIVKFGKKVMLSPLELDKYAEGRENKEAIVLSLDKIHKYQKVKKVRNPVTMGGIYVTKSNKKSIFIGK